MVRDFGDPIYKDWRKKVLRRDSYKCQMPGCKRRGKRMQVHHIQKWSAASSLRYETSNGITLCWDCHKEVNGKEGIYSGLFYGIVQRNDNENSN
jgi:5-methylcytosine-specific restriction endonuclease McrA